MPVTRGERLAAFFWVQSMVPDDAARALLFDLDQTIQSLSVGRPKDDPDIDRLTHVYHNLLRRWAQV
jgi:PKHD-type hydroxylase